MKTSKKKLAVERRNTRRRLQRLVRRLASMTCPFCGQKQIFAYPTTQCRPWWVVGCQSILCDSTWHIDKNCGETVLAMFENCQPNRKPSNVKLWHGGETQQPNEKTKL